MKTMHWAIIGVIVVGIIILALTGKASTSSVVTLGFLALCPLMMIFMHGGHGGDKGGHKH